ncbi:MAG: hypothetical protein EWM72_02589 [Nitrospira sp.]|nr:MAG: hypothetical protein EWM72_02589 [Nitrospira sp.]
MMDMVLAGVAATVLLLMLWWSLAASRKTGVQLSSFVLQPGVTITSAPLLTEGEVFLYNLMRMTVQDHYLVFAQVPLWSFVSVEAMGKARSQVLSHMALKRVDFVLVHPGSRQVEQVVQIEDASPQPHQAERQRVIESVLDAAGIKLVKVRSKKSYTIPDLAALLGLEAEE